MMFLIMKLWQDSMENQNAYGYDPYAVTSSPDAFDLEKIIVSKNGWPLMKDTPEYKVVAVKIFDRAEVQKIIWNNSDGHYSRN